MANELILIVEDNPKNLKLVRDTLQVKGYQTIETETGEEGVRLARERRPALILMDIQLPGINGDEALRQLRADPMTSAVPVIVVTANDSLNNAIASIKVGAFHFISKPYVPDELLNMVGKALESHGLKLLVDRESLQFVRGSVIDYEESLQGAGFKVENPNVVAACGCGSSFRVAEEEQVSAV